MTWKSSPLIWHENGRQVATQKPRHGRKGNKWQRATVDSLYVTLDQGITMKLIHFLERAPEYAKWPFWPRLYSKSIFKSMKHSIQSAFAGFVEIYILSEGRGGTRIQ